MPIKEETLAQNAGRQHPVPQNVMDVEFKVVGDLTIRQLMYLFFGAGLAYVLWRSGLPGFWRVILVSLISSLSIAVAFVPYQERSLDKWIISFVNAMIKPTQLIWRKTYSPPAYFLADYAEIIKNEIITLTPAKSRNKLEEYLGQLPEAQNELDQLETQRMQNLQAYYSQSTVAVPEPEAFKPLPPSLTGETEGQKKDALIAVIEDDEIETDIITTPPEEPPEQPPEETKKEEPENPQPEETPAPKTKIKSKLETQQPKEEKVELLEPVKEDEIKAKQEFLDAYTKPDLPAGNLRDRPMINLPLEIKGEIKINTTTRLPKTIVEQNIKGIENKESDLSRKVGELIEVMTKAKDQFTTIQTHADIGEQHHSRLEFFKSKYDELEQERAKISNQLDKSTSRVKQLEKHEDKSALEQQVEDLTSRNTELKQQLAFIQNELNNLKYSVEHPGEQAPQQANPQPQQAAAQQQPAQNQGQPQQMQEMNINQNKQKKQLTEEEQLIMEQRDVNGIVAKGQQSATQKTKHPYGANVIHGIVKTKDGQLAENAVVIIKDKDGDPIRALKTNTLGQFKTQTPVQNGQYTIDVIKGGDKFDIMSIEAHGEPLDAIYIIGS